MRSAQVTEPRSREGGMYDNFSDSGSYRCSDLPFCSSRILLWFQELVSPVRRKFITLRERRIVPKFLSGIQEHQFIAVTAIDDHSLT